MNISNATGDQIASRFYAILRKSLTWQHNTQRYVALLYDTILRERKKMSLANDLSKRRHDTNSPQRS